MGDAHTLGGAMADIFTYAGTAAFTWVPATVLTIVKGIPLPNTDRPIMPGDIVDYLSQNAPDPIYESFYTHWAMLVSLSIVLSLMVGSLIIYCAIRIMEVRRHERERLAGLVHTVAAHDVPKTQLRWNRIVEQSSTEDDQNWRLAILEADIMLNELLDVRGYRGETMADKMKQVDRADFNTIDLAWEAHKVRNAIAHEGSARMLTQREVRRIISLYEQVFREFRFVE